LIKRAATVIGICLIAAAVTPAHAVDRDPTTKKFNWGDDLSETPYTSDCVTGALNCTQAPPTQFKSTHLPDIKQAIDLSVTACSITSDVYLQTDREAIAQIGYPGKLVSSTHVNNLRRAIEALYDARNDNTVGDYFTGSVDSGQPVLKSDINNMRRALDDLAATCVAGPAQVCGNGSCETGEDCGSCPGDCVSQLIGGVCVGGNWACPAGTSFVDLSGSGFPCVPGGGLCGFCFDPSGIYVNDPGPIASGPGCWVAAELFGGWYEPKTVAARHYINDIGPSWFKKLYLEHGLDFARFIKDKPILKTAIRPLFEYFSQKSDGVKE